MIGLIPANFNGPAVYDLQPAIIEFPARWRPTFPASRRSSGTH